MISHQAILMSEMHRDSTQSNPSQTKRSCDGDAVLTSTSRADRSGFHLPEGAVRWPVVFGEGPELERVKGVFSRANVLHRVFSSAALAVKTKEAGGGETRRVKTQAKRTVGSRHDD